MMIVVICRKDFIMLPSNTKASIDRYANDKVPTGGFLYAVLTNDLFEAVGRADHVNINCLPDICEYIYNNIPYNSWGSVDAVKKWLGKE